MGPNIYKIKLELFVTAVDERMALAQAELATATCTAALRKVNSSFVQDTFTIMHVPEDAKAAEVGIEAVPVDSFDKERLIEAFGEKRAIRFIHDALERIDT